MSVAIEADETVLSRRGIIREPISPDDDTQGTIWVVGFIDHTNAKIFFVKLFPNRQALTLTVARNFIHRRTVTIFAEKKLM